MRFLGVAFALSIQLFAATAIRDVTVIDVVSASLQPHMTVLIEKDRIEAIGRQVAVPARVITPGILSPAA